MEYEPDADMIFNYLMVSALAAATDLVEREGLRPTGGEHIEYCIILKAAALSFTRHTKT